jgi:hypothetical protein
MPLVLNILEELAHRGASDGNEPSLQFIPPHFVME